MYKVAELHGTIADAIAQGEKICFTADPDFETLGKLGEVFSAVCVMTENGRPIRADSVTHNVYSSTEADGMYSDYDADVFKGGKVYFVSPHIRWSIWLGVWSQTTAKHAADVYKVELPSGNLLGDMTAEQLQEAVNNAVLVPKPEKGTEIRSTQRQTYAETEDETPRRGRPAKPWLTTELLASELAERGGRARFNVISHEVEIYGLDIDGTPSREAELDDIVIWLYDKLGDSYRTTELALGGRLASISHQKGNRYNPFLELMETGEPWDGKDRIKELFDILRINTKTYSNNLSQQLITKWLRQAVVLQFNYERDIHTSAEGILTFVSPVQGIGKTQFARMLGFATEFCEGKPQGKHREFFKQADTIDLRNKDDIIKTTQYFIAELGEVDAVFRKSDNSSLKQFITRDADEYRLPYGRVPISNPRITSFIASCNDPKYLQNDGSNRRWWTIPLDGKKLDNDRMEHHFDAYQLWKQVYEYVMGNVGEKPLKELFVLTPIEISALAKRNAGYTAPLKAEAEVIDIITDEQETPSRYKWRKCTVSQFIQCYDILRRYSSADVGRVLAKVGIPSTKSHGAQLISVPLPCLVADEIGKPVEPVDINLE